MAAVDAHRPLVDGARRLGLVHPERRSGFWTGGHGEVRQKMACDDKLDQRVFRVRFDQQVPVVRRLVVSALK